MKNLQVSGPNGFIGSIAISVLFFIGVGVVRGDVFLSGKISDKSGVSIAGASVTLVRAQLTSATNGRGEYILSNTEARAVGKYSSTPGLLRMSNGTIRILLDRPLRFSVDILTMNGKKIARFPMRTYDKGSYFLAVPSLHNNHNPFLFDIRTQDTRNTGISLQGVTWLRGEQGFSSSGAISKQDGITGDTLMIQHQGYQTRRIPLLSPSGVFDAMLYGESSCSGVSFTDLKHFSVAFPGGSEMFTQGEKIQLHFCSADTEMYDIEQAGKFISFRDSMFWYPIESAMKNVPGGKAVWTIQDSVYDSFNKKWINTASLDCRIKIVIYSSQGDPSVDWALSAGPFGIQTRK